MIGTEKNRKIVVLLGEHRSGTSLSAKIFNRLGLPLGDELLPGHADNPEGFYEHRDIISETKSIEEILDLNPFNGARFLPPDGDWWNRKELSDNYQRLRSILQKEFARRNLFGFKDPRTLLLLPLWRKLFEEEGFTPVVVILMRHPEAVARSIEKRHGFSVAHGAYIWTLHWSYAISNLEEAPDAILHYENWFLKPEEQTNSILRILGNDGIDPEQAREAVREIVKPDLRHQGEDASSNGLMEETISLYNCLCGKLEDSTWAQARKTAEDTLRRFGKFIPVYESVAAQKNRIAKKLRSREEKLEQLQSKVNRLVSQNMTHKGTENGIIAAKAPINTKEIEFQGLRSFNHAISGPGKKLKVCIATEDIVGPVRNGGIGTTYTHLSKLLSRAGHDTHILYLRSEYCENMTLEHWVDYYRQFNVNFVPLDSSQYPIDSSAPRWLQPMYALYEYLKNEHFDMVHVSEWHGSGYLALAAKKQGLAFQDTMFCVKTSSPWLWNREYGLHTIRDMTDLPRMYAEQKSVELADIVIGGSAHLLRWMVEHGYNLPDKYVYMQPNVMIPLNMDELAEERRKLYGKRLPIDEMVFFGRLEYRKGLDIFLDAIEILINKGVRLPQIFLMGKFGERIPSHPELSIPEYIAQRSKKWPVKLKILTNYNNEEALRFLLGGNRLAVMPSRIENSSLAVYETAYYGIPFIASDRGGNPELVLESDREKVLVDAHPLELSRKIHEALVEGGFIARPSFDNKNNLATWLLFHAAVGGYISSLPKTLVDEQQGKSVRPSISICLVVSDDHEYAKELVEVAAEKLKENESEVVIINNGSSQTETLKWLDSLRGSFGDTVVVEDIEKWGEQHAQNKAASIARGDILLFPNLGTIFKDNCLDIIRTAAFSSGADILCCFYDVVPYEDYRSGECNGARRAVMPEDPVCGFFDTENVSPLLAVKKDAFHEIGGFEEIYSVSGADLELLSKAHLANLHIVTIPEALILYVQNWPTEKKFNERALPYRSILPYMQLSSQFYCRILMTARGICNDIHPRRGGFSKNGLLSGIPINGSITPLADTSDLSSKLGHYPRLRDFGLRVYNYQIRLFSRLVHFEMKLAGRLVNLVRRVRSLGK